MILSQCIDYNDITIQTHDNPDADAIGSGYALYTYFQQKGKHVRLIYSGRYRIKKTNLKMLVRELHIPIEYVEPTEDKFSGLLITVDCQHGAGNVTLFQADEVVVIDHHQIETNEKDENKNNSIIQPEMGCCATLVWKMLKKEGFDICLNPSVSTALYYGLYCDTNRFSEIIHPQDLDMRDDLTYDESVINKLRYSNLSLEDLEIAGIALIRHEFHEKYHYAIIQTKPCDPNILGLISDFLIQVDQIYTCIVYNTSPVEMKFSVRSCIKEVKANELAQFLAKEVGTGGGHVDKAGGFIGQRKLDELYPDMQIEHFFSGRMNSYFETQKINMRNYEGERE